MTSHTCSLSCIFWSLKLQLLKVKTSMSELNNDSQKEPTLSSGYTVIQYLKVLLKCNGGSMSSSRTMHLRKSFHYDSNSVGFGRLSMIVLMLWNLSCTNFMELKLIIDETYFLQCYQSCSALRALASFHCFKGR